MRQRGLSGSALKLIAIISMFIDHAGAAVLARVFIQDGGSELLYKVYYAMRDVGRIAFPIFCFLLVEGFLHTGNMRKYALRLLVFALLSEVPFDLAFSSRLLEYESQNVFFTLFIGLLTMMAFHDVEERTDWHPLLRGAALAGIALAGMGAAELLRTDYAAKGVLCILILYIFRKARGLQILAGCLFFCWWELPALVAFILIAFYNGKRGWCIRYFFYLFYPAHLLLLYGICCCMGNAGVFAA